MKKILILIVLTLVTVVACAQNSLDSTSVKPNCGITPYVAAGLSMSNNTNNFSLASYPSMEIGVMFENISVAGVFGRNNLARTPNETINNYWMEAKVAYSFPLGWVDGYGVFGIGTYFGTKNSLFIEYGGGISKTLNDHIGTFIQVSNWDGVMYLTPGISVSF